MTWPPELSARHRAFPAAPLALLAIVTATWLLTVAGLAHAGPPTDTLRATFTEANKIISDPATEDRPLERLTAIRALFSRVFDFRSAAERVLGPQWQARTATEQKEFTALFAGFVQRGFVYWLASVAAIDGDGGGITVHYLSESVDRDRAVVRTAIVGRGGRQILLEHDMAYQGRRWMLRDISIDGVSLVANYRAQFDRVIRGSSYRDLVARMQERVATDLPRPASVRPDTRGPDVLHLRSIESR
jgi:phospholipid transport system substrate-binding protein